MTIEIETVEQLLHHGYAVGTWCPACKYRGPELDLAKYCLQGRGKRRPIDLKLKHSRCKTLLQLTVIPAKGYGK